MTPAEPGKATTGYTSSTRKPPRSAWRVIALARLDRMQSRFCDRDESCTLTSARQLTEKAANELARAKRSTLGEWWSGSSIESVWLALHEADALLAETEPEDRLSVLARDVLVWTRPLLGKEDTRIARVKTLLSEKASKRAPGHAAELRQTIAALIRAGNEVSDERYERSRNFRNRLIRGSILIALVGLVALPLLASWRPDIVPVCRSAEPTAAASSNQATSAAATGSGPTCPAPTPADSSSPQGAPSAAPTSTASTMGEAGASTATASTAAGANASEAAASTTTPAPSETPSGTATSAPPTDIPGAPATASGNDRAGGDDVLVVALLGALGGFFTIIPTLRNMGGSRNPYGLPLWQALLKIPAGALTAVIGVALLVNDFLPGLDVPTTKAELSVWALLLGVSQIAATRLIDRRGNELLAATPSKDEAKHLSAVTDGSTDA